MGILKTGLKLVGSVALGTVGVVSTVLRTAANAADSDGLADAIGNIQNKSFDTIRDMWTPDERKDNEYYESQDMKSEERAYNSKLNAAHQCRNMAEVAKKAGNDEKYNLYMDKYHALKEEADIIKQEMNTREFV